MRPLVVAAAVFVVLAASASAAQGPRWTWRSLHRPLHLPRLEPGSACPVSSPTKIDLGEEGVRFLPGRGPAYPVLDKEAALSFWYPPTPSHQDFYGSGWSGNKVPRWVRGAYHGPVLIRGRQLDGPHLLRFEVGRPVPPKEMRIKPGPGWGPWKGARDRPSYTRVEAPGCYGYQIDGLAFSSVIVFRAVQVPPPPTP